MCVSAGSRELCSVLINSSLSKQVAGAGTKEKQAVLRPAGACQGGVMARRSDRRTLSSGSLFSQLGVVPCAKHLMPVNMKTGVGTLCQEDSVPPGVLTARSMGTWKQGKYVTPLRLEDSSKVSFLEEAEAPSPARLVTVTQALHLAQGIAPKGHL